MGKIVFRRAQKLLCFLFIFSLCILPALAESYASSNKLVPIGKTTGIILHSNGVIISDFSIEYGSSPAKDAGLKIGDIIISVNNQKITDKSSFVEVIDNIQKPEITVCVLRNNEKISYKVKPIYDSKTDSYILGIKAKDTIAGIGTITYIDPQTGDYGALGHGIYDNNSSVEMYSKGRLIESEVTDIEKGKKGDPGELIGSFDLNENIGSVDSNTNSGIFGNITNVKDLCAENALEIGSSDSVIEGNAYILSNIEGDKVEKYDIKIVKINDSKDNMRQMLIEVTDDKLLSKTGGIVQGMSGSPVIQNGKLVGAVTHVLINDPTRGYGIFIENMLKAAG